MEISLIYLSDLPQYETEKLYELWVPTEPGVAKTNREFSKYNYIPLTDARRGDTKFEFDTTGFKFINRPARSLPSSEEFQRHLEQDAHASECPDFLVPYLHETIQFMKELFQAETVVCFDWRYRKNKGPQTYEIDETNPERVNSKNVTRIVHMDESFAGGATTLERQLSGHELKEFRREGYQTKIVTCWRPLVDVVQNAPLALCDRRSVGLDEPVPCDKVMSDYVDESCYLKYNENHRWYYLSDQTRDEATVFVIWNSHKDKTYLVGPPHASFDIPDEVPGSAPRESIETRFIVVSKEVR